jgi:hypothetical protein
MFVYGKFASEEDAAGAVRALMGSGFDVRYISALMRSDAGLSEIPMSVESGVTRGAVLGAALGAAGGALLGTAPGLLVAGPFLAGLEAAIGGSAVGAIPGGVLGMLFGDTKVDFEEKDLEEGAILIGVNADTRSELAGKLLTENGAIRVRERNEPIPAK